MILGLAAGLETAVAGPEIAFGLRCFVGAACLFWLGMRM
jgi:threonine/homoserine/homoserine lactone efflux protein